MKPKSIEFAIIVLGALVFGIGAITIVQYSIGHPEFSAWTGFAAMSSPAAIAFSLIGIALILLTYKK